MTRLASESWTGRTSRERTFVRFAQRALSSKLIRRQCLPMIQLSLQQFAKALVLVVCHHSATGVCDSPDR